MKKKMVVKVTMNGDKSRSKALRIAVGLSGVESASLKGDDKSQIEVTGDGVDAVKLTSLLRKSVGHAELVSVADDKKEEKKEEPKPEQQFYYVSTPYYPQNYYQAAPPYGYVEDHEPSCSIIAPIVIEDVSSISLGGEVLSFLCITGSASPSLALGNVYMTFDLDLWR
ncbi:hypothetical protein V6N13_071781 [Hibiscus sabdariffa]